MNYLIAGMITGVVFIGIAEVLWVQKGDEKMTEAILFLLGFTCVSTIYEISKTGKVQKTDSLKKAKDTYKRILK